MHGYDPAAKLMMSLTMSRRIPNMCKAQHEVDRATLRCCVNFPPLKECAVTVSTLNGSCMLQNETADSTRLVAKT